MQIASKYWQAHIMRGEWQVMLPSSKTHQKIQLLHCIWWLPSVDFAQAPSTRRSRTSTALPAWSWPMLRQHFLSLTACTELTYWYTFWGLREASLVALRGWGPLQPASRWWALPTLRAFPSPFHWWNMSTYLGVCFNSLEMWARLFQEHITTI